MKMQNDILYAFNLYREINSLKGGQNTSVRVNDAVLKPVGENDQFCERALSILSKINPEKYRLSKPIISNNGTYI